MAGEKGKSQLSGADRKTRVIFDLKKRKQFLKELTRTCNITMAAHKVGIHKYTAHQAKAKDEDFSEAWDNALDEGIDLLEEFARKRAFDGVKREVYYQGKVCGKFHEYSDGLTKFLLRAHKPERYSDRTDLNVKHSGGVLLIPAGQGTVEDWMKENATTMEESDEVKNEFQ